MKAYIHGFRGGGWNRECSVASEGFKKLGVDTVFFTTNEEFDTRKPEDVVVGADVIIWHALNQKGIVLEHFDYPPELTVFLGRKIEQVKLKDIKNEILPVFIKPVEEKAATGLVVKSMADLEQFEIKDPEAEVYCSDVVHFVSEWRCFLLYGQIVGVKYYFGDPDVEADIDIILAAVKAYPNMPAGCALDFGVTDDGRTLLIEMNDGYSLGVYGLEDTMYARLLSARWAELNGSEDIFKDMPIYSLQKERELYEERLGLPGGDVDLTEEEIAELIREGRI